MREIAKYKRGKIMELPVIKHVIILFMLLFYSILHLLQYLKLVFMLTIIMEIAIIIQDKNSFEIKINNKATKTNNFILFLRITLDYV